MTTPRLLLVEPNPRLQAMLERAAEGIAEVQTASGYHAARAFLLEGAPDLVLSEFRLPDGTALDLLEALRSLVEPPPLLVMASRAETVDRLRPFSARLEDIIQKPFLGADVRERIKQALNRNQFRQALARPETAQLRGRLQDLSPVDLLQALDLGRKNATVRLRSDHGGRARISLQDGQVRDAEWLELPRPDATPLRGEEVAYEALGWDAGDFEVQFGEAPSTITVTSSTQRLLMEGLRRLDESRFGMR